MPGTEVASLYARIGADVSGFMRGMSSTKKELNTFERTSKAVGTGLKLAMGVGVAAVGGLGFAFSKAVSGAAGLQQQSANISAVYGNMAPPIQEVKDLIGELGINPKLKVSIDEAGAAIEMLAKNGATWSDVQDGLAEKTILLANATGSDFGLAADVATDAMAMFGLGVKDMDKIVAGATSVTLNSKNTLEDYAYVLANAGPIASNLGVDLEELNAITALTAFNFNSGRTQGTSFEYMLSNLNPKTDKAKDLMKELGLMTEDGGNAFFDASGRLKDMSEIMRILQRTFGQFTPQQQESYAAAIFGKEAYGALSAILQSNVSDYERLLAASTDMSAVMKGAETRTNTYAAAMDMLHDTIATLMAMVGDKFLPILSKMVRGFTEFISSKSERIVDWFALLAFNIQSFIDYITAAFTSGDPLGPLFDAFSKLWELITTGNFQGGIFGQTEDSPLIGFFNKLREVFDQVIFGSITVGDALIVLAGIIAANLIRSLASFVVAAAPVLGWFALAVAAVAALRIAWVNDWGGIQEKTRAVLDYLQMRFGPLLATIRQFGAEALQEIIAWVTGTGNEFSALNAIWTSVKETFGLVWQDIQGMLTAWGDKIREWGGIAWEWFGENFPEAAAALKGAWEEIKGAWQGLWDVLKPLIDSGIEWFQDLWESLTTGTTDVGGAFETLKAIVDPILAAISSLAGTAFANIIDWVTILVQLITGDWEGAWTTLQGSATRTWETLQGVWLNIKEAASAMWNAVQPIYDDWMGKIREWLGVAEDSEQPWKDAWDGITSKISDAWNTYGKPVLDGWIAKIQEWIGIAWNAFSERFPKTASALTGAYESIKQSFVELWNVIKPLLDAAIQRFKDWTGGWQTDSGTLKRILDGLGVALDITFANIVTIISTAISNITDVIKLIVQVVTGDWKGAWETAQGIAERTWNAIKTIVKNVVDAIDTIFGTDLAAIARDIETWGKNLIEGLWRGVKSKWESFVAWWKARWNELKTAWNRLWDAHSPSRFFEKSGAGWMRGLEIGIDKNAANVLGSIRDLSAGVVAGPEGMGRDRDLAAAIRALVEVLQSRGGNQISVNMAGVADSRGGDLRTTVEYLQAMYA